MSKRAVFDPETISKAKMILDELSYGDTTLMAVSVLMAGVLNLTGQEIGSVLGVSVSTVIRMNERFRGMELGESKRWGGDRRSILSDRDTKEVLSALEDQAAKGHVVVVEQVKAALEEKRGSAISLQTAYNVLHRQGWRKVTPDKEHPKCDPEKQEAFKKKTSHKRYVWLPSRQMQLIDR